LQRCRSAGWSDRVDAGNASPNDKGMVTTGTGGMPRSDGQVGTKGGRDGRELSAGGREGKGKGRGLRPPAPKVQSDIEIRWPRLTPVFYKSSTRAEEWVSPVQSN